MKPNKNNTVQTTRVIDENDQVVEVSDVGVPGLFAPQAWDIAEEMQNNEALREHRQEERYDSMS